MKFKTCFLLHLTTETEKRFTTLAKLFARRLGLKKFRSCSYMTRHFKTSCLSANAAVRVGHYSWTISTSTQNAYVWSLTAAAPSDGVFRALCRPPPIKVKVKVNVDLYSASS